MKCVVCSNGEPVKHGEEWYLGSGYALCCFHGEKMLARHRELFNVLYQAIDKEMQPDSHHD